MEKRPGEDCVEKEDSEFRDIRAGAIFLGGTQDDPRLAETAVEDIFRNHRLAEERKDMAKSQ